MAGIALGNELAIDGHRTASHELDDHTGLDGQACIERQRQVALDDIREIVLPGRVGVKRPGHHDAVDLVASSRVAAKSSSRTPRDVYRIAAVPGEGVIEDLRR